MISGHQIDELKIYMFAESIDMRKQVNGLLAIIETSFKLNPYEQTLFVFFNKSRDKVKALRWDENGFVFYYKRLKMEISLKKEDMSQCKTAIKLSVYKGLWLFCVCKIANCT